MPLLKAIVVPADHKQSLRIEEIERGDLAHYNRLVGGYIEVVNLSEPDCSMYLNEEGKQQELPVNQQATAIVWVHNPAFIDQDFIVGDAFLLGPPDQNGNDTSVPEQLVKLLLFTRIYGLEVRVREGGPWMEMHGRYVSWFAAYMAAIEVYKNWDPIDAVRVVARR